MNRIELLNLLEAPDLSVRVHAKDLTDQHVNRTLLLGDGTNGSKLHVWLTDGRLHRADFVGRRWELHQDGTSLPLRLLVADGRIYPESSDYEFINLLRNRLAPLVFHRYDDGAETQREKDWGPYRYQTTFDRAPKHLR